MNYLGIDYDIKNVPVLDEQFIPFGVWMKAYLEGANQPIAVAVEREDGLISVRESFIRGGEFAEADFRYVERLVKFELWSIGGFRVYLRGCDDIAAKLAEAYSPEGARVRLRLRGRCVRESFGGCGVHGGRLPRRQRGCQKDRRPHGGLPHRL